MERIAVFGEFSISNLTLTFPLLVSPQSTPIPTKGIVGDLFYSKSNCHGSSDYESEVVGKIVIVLRGRVTLDTKVRHAQRAGAKVVIIVDTTGDPIGPDLDEVAGIIVCCLSKEDGKIICNHFDEDNSFAASATLRPAPSLFGYVVSENRAGVVEWLNTLNCSSLSVPFDSSECRDMSGHTPIHFASARNSSSLAEILSLLLDAKVFDVLAIDGVKGQSAQHIAANNGAFTAIELLSSYGAEMKPRTSDGRYPMHLAAAASQPECLKAQHRVGANMKDAKANDGVTTPVYLAARAGSLECTRFLLRECCCDATDAYLTATGLAQQYLFDIYSYELESFVNCEASYGEEIATYARTRLTEELGEFIDIENIDVVLNQHGRSPASSAPTGGSSPRQRQLEEHNRHQAAGLYVSRHRQLLRSYAASSSSFPPLRFLWHGCDARIIETIMSGGFKTSYSNLTFNVYGAGIYFATDAKLSSYFITNNVREGTRMEPDEDGYFSIILAAVSIGTVGVRTPLLGGNELEKQRMKGDLKHPANRNPPVGCDSATGSFLKELVVYEDTLSFPIAQVRFKLLPGVDIPDPYKCDAVNRGYLRDLRSVPTGLGSFSTLDGHKTTLDNSALDIQMDAKLVMGWTPDGQSEMSTEDLLNKIGELETRVAVLERENEALRRQHPILHTSPHEK